MNMRAVRQGGRRPFRWRAVGGMILLAAFPFLIGAAGRGEDHGGPPPVRPGQTPLTPGVDGVTEPELIPGTKVLPVYPEAARKVGAPGKVTLRAVIRRDGTVGDIKVLEEPPGGFGFGRAAIEAVRQWRYRPATKDGRPVDVYLTIVVNFQLASAAKPRGESAPPPVGEARGGKVLAPGVDGVTEPELIPGTKVRPVYPKAAQAAGVSGKVTLRAVIHRDGTVGDIKVLRESPGGFGFGRAAIDAVQQWRYRPAMKDGCPVDVYFRVVVNFQLAGTAGSGGEVVPLPVGEARGGKVLTPGVDGVTKPELIPGTRVRPVYPEAARKLKAEGYVILRAVIRRDGTVGDLKVLKEEPGGFGFGRAAIRAVRKWRYRAATKDGRPVDVLAAIIVSFDVPGTAGPVSRPRSLRVRGRQRRKVLTPGEDGVTEPELIPGTKVRPVSPEAARAAGVSGTVILRAVIRRDGTVGDLEVLEEVPGGFGFGRAAIEAVRQWRYRPATRDGEPIDVYFTIIVLFD